MQLQIAAPAIGDDVLAGAEIDDLRVSGLEISL